MQSHLSKRDFLKAIGLGAISLSLPGIGYVATVPRDMPNVVLCMADDLGWADTGYNGHPVLKTPNLDDMAGKGVRFDRFYSGAPVCSPTRGSCLTGRHPYRYGIFGANAGHMPPREITLAEALKTQGYATGHFGKWHLGTLTKTIRESNRGGQRRHAKHYSPPWDNGFDVCFSTEAKVPTWDPMKHPETGEPYGTFYWKEDGTRETENLEGDDSRIIMDRAIPFIQSIVEAGEPFFAVIWFHTPHLPTVAGPKYKQMYPDQPDKEQTYYGIVTAMDEQIGRLRRELRDLGVADNTMLWFCSDNGPEGQAGKAPGSAGYLRGRKRDLFEGGIRVPGIVEWPERIRSSSVIKMPCVTSDYYPTVLDVLDLDMEGQPEPVDGISLLPAIAGEMTERPTPIGFESKNRLALIDNQYKLVRPGKDAGFMLFDIPNDPGETRDLAAEKPKVFETMKKTLMKWQESCTRSRDGLDYGL